MGTTFNAGQLAQLSSVINIGIATALPKVAQKLDPKITLRALDGRGEIFAGHLAAALEQAINKMFLLGTPSTAIVTLAERHDPAAFFQTREGLYVWDDFRNRVVSKARSTEAGTSFKVNHSLLSKQMGDEEIEASLPKAHVFDNSVVCAVIAGLIKRQPNGEEGHLLNNGYANLFYTSSCVVDVLWDAAYRKWRVLAWQRGDYGWSAGGRVFSPAIVA